MAGINFCDDNPMNLARLDEFLDCVNTNPVDAEELTIQDIIDEILDTSKVTILKSGHVVWLTPRGMVDPCDNPDIKAHIRGVAYEYCASLTAAQVNRIHEEVTLPEQREDQTDIYEAITL